MTTSVITITHDATEAAMLHKLAAEEGDKRKFAVRFANFINALAAGAEKATLDVQIGEGSAVAASATIALASVQADDVVTIGGVALTAVSGTPAAGQFDISGTDTEAGDSLVAAIEGNAILNASLTASNAAGTVTVTARVKGDIGNLCTLAEDTSGARITVSGARLASGADASANSFGYGE